MGKFNKFLNLIGFGEEDDTDVRPSSSGRDSGASRMSSAASTPRKSTSSSRPVSASGPSRVVSMQQGMSVPDPMRMMLLQPQSFEDTQMVIDNLREGKSVIVNLENMNQGTAQRVLDFISGAIYALDGDMRKVSKGIFLCAPSGIDISGNVASSFASSLRKSDRR